MFVWGIFEVYKQINQCKRQKTLPIHLDKKANIVFLEIVSYTQKRQNNLTGRGAKTELERHFGLNQFSANEFKIARCWCLYD